MRPRLRQLSSLEASFLETAVNSARTAIGAVSSITSDPALPEVVGLLGELAKIEAVRAKGRPPSTEPGVGLRKVVMPLKVVIAVRRKPWLIPVSIAAVLLVPFTIGFAIGRR